MIQEKSNDFTPLENIKIDRYLIIRHVLQYLRTNLKTLIFTQLMENTRCIIETILVLRPGLDIGSTGRVPGGLGTK